MMNVYIYDGTFEGLLSVVFAVYSTKTLPDQIVSEKSYQPSLLERAIRIQTDDSHALRVVKGVEQKTAIGQGHVLFRVFLSEKVHVERLIYDYIRLVMDSPLSLDGNYINPTLLAIKQIDYQIGRELHRMHAFIRFQKTIDGVYFATIEPDFNIIPLVGAHFEKRYADQPWIIYDTKRKYGIYYDLTQIWDMTIENLQLNTATGNLQDEASDVKESKYQDLWKLYFDAVNIVERKNIKLHLRHMPKRYWKYLTEKK